MLSGAARRAGLAFVRRRGLRRGRITFGAPTRINLKEHPMRRTRFLGLIALAACTPSNDNGAQPADSDTLPDTDTPIVPAATDTGTRVTPPLLGSSFFGVGSVHDPAWIQQFGGDGYDDAFDI